MIVDINSPEVATSEPEGEEVAPGIPALESASPSSPTGSAEKKKKKERVTGTAIPDALPGAHLLSVPPTGGDLFPAEDPDEAIAAEVAEMTSGGSVERVLAEARPSDRVLGSDSKAGDSIDDVKAELMQARAEVESHDSDSSDSSDSYDSSDSGFDGGD